MPVRFQIEVNRQKRQVGEGRVPETRVMTSAPDPHLQNTRAKTSWIASVVSSLYTHAIVAGLSSTRLMAGPRADQPSIRPN